MLFVHDTEHKSLLNNYYRIIVDRYALPAGADLKACDPGMQSFCGGTWNTIRQNLDYVQNAGFTASGFYCNKNTKIAF